MTAQQSSLVAAGASVVLGGAAMLAAGSEIIPASTMFGFTSDQLANLTYLAATVASAPGCPEHW
jgi:hypothetical protein